MRTKKFKEQQHYFPMHESHHAYDKYDPYSDEFFEKLPNKTVLEIYTKDQVLDWMSQALVETVLTEDSDTPLFRNYYFGENRARFSFRRLKLQ